LKKYEGPEEILYKFFKCRKKMYNKRYKYMVDELGNRVKKISAQVGFIQGIMDNKIKVFRVPKKGVIEQLEYNNFPKWERKYDYLTDMKIDNFTDEKIKQLEKQSSRLQVELKVLEKKTPIDLWKEDLGYLEKHL
jgi:DNA gyrase/topoisomerase IV subunit A